MLTPAAKAAASLWRIEAQARPGLLTRWASGEPEHDHRDDQHVAVVAEVGLGDVGPTHRVDCWRPRRRAPEAGPTARELGVGEDDRKAAAAISVTRARYSPCSRSAGRPSSTPITAVITPAIEDQHRIRPVGREAEPHRDPGADAVERDLAEGDETDPPVQHAGRSGDDREDRGAREVLDPERRRQCGQHEHRDHEDHDGDRRLDGGAPAEAARDGDRLAGGRRRASTVVIASPVRRS